MLNMPSSPFPARRRTRLWIENALEYSETARLRATIRYIEDILNSARMEAGLYPLAFWGRRGRPPVAHPLPRRKKGLLEVCDAETHHVKHRAEYVTGCQRCYLREYMYFRKHPERKPDPRWWNPDDSGLPRGSARLKSTPRKWVDENWDKYHPGKQPGKLERTIAASEELIEEARKVK